MQSRPKFGTMHQSRAAPTGCGSNVAKIAPDPTNFGRCSSKLGRGWPNSADNAPSLADVEIGAERWLSEFGTKVGQFRPTNFGICRPKSGRVRQTLDRRRPNLGHVSNNICARVANLRTLWPILDRAELVCGRCRPILGKSRPSLALGRRRRTLGRSSTCRAAFCAKLQTDCPASANTWPNIAHIRATRGRSLPKFAQGVGGTRSNLGCAPFSQTSVDVGPDVGRQRHDVGIFRPSLADVCPKLPRSCSSAQHRPISLKIWPLANIWTKWAPIRYTPGLAELCPKRPNIGRTWRYNRAKVGQCLPSLLYFVRRWPHTGRNLSKFGAARAKLERSLPQVGPNPALSGTNLADFWPSLH